MLRVLLAATIFLSQSFACAQITPSIVNPPTSPLQIVSITSTLSDFLHVVRVMNVSDRPIASFQLGVIMTVPALCGPQQVIGDELLMRRDRMDVSPGGNAETLDYVFSPKDVARFGVDNLAKVVHTQLAVVKVDFADGGSWSFSRPGKTYDDSLMTANAELQCSKSTKAVLARAAAVANCAFPLGG